MEAIFILYKISWLKLNRNVITQISIKLIYKKQQKYSSNIENLIFHKLHTEKYVIILKIPNMIYR